MIRDVDLVSYLPPFMQTYKEPVAALEAENHEFQIIWKAKERILYNRFISTADEYGISRFEKILGIHPSKEDTLEIRRLRVQNKWFNKIPYTIRVLFQKLTILCGDTDFTLTHNFDVGYTLTLETQFEVYEKLEELEYMLSTVLPCNIVPDVQNTIMCDANGTVFMVGGVAHAQYFFVSDEERTKEIKLQDVMVDFTVTETTANRKDEE